jgi:hypothetical protein
MILHLGREHIECALDEPRRAVRVVAGAASAHLGGPAKYAIAFALVRDPVGE